MRLLAKREAGSLSAAEADELQQILASLIYTLPPVLSDGL